MHIVLLAAENDALPGGKVGGLGDVIRDLPLSLSQAGHQVSVVTPGYGIFAAAGNSRRIANFKVDFCGHSESLDLFEVEPRQQARGVKHLALEHSLFSAAGVGKIYVNDTEGPFATDAHKFALLCAATAEALNVGLVEQADVLHCHDWHASILLLLRRFDPRYTKLKKINAVFSIHNLSLQGVRPLRGVQSSLESWFPGLAYEGELISDPAHWDCINMMRTGINLANRVHTVSPTYATEILRPSNWREGIVGGEGLEQDLQRIHDEGRLLGILNGCDYSHINRQPIKSIDLWRLVESSLDDWVARNESDTQTYYFALKCLAGLKCRRKTGRPALVSIGRITEQKMYLMVQNYGAMTVMDALLKRLQPGIFIMLGTGDRDYESFFTRIMQKHDNFLYLRGYSDDLAEALYGYGDLFVMPSIYEPCGISQMLAMRAGVPCLVHQVGGLNDTVNDGENGISFDGNNLREKLGNLIDSLDRALIVYNRQPDVWKKIVNSAANSRFLWEESIIIYLKELYCLESP